MAKKKKAKRAKKAKAKKAGGLFANLKKKVTTHTHPLPTCEGDTHDPECATKKKELSCNQVSVGGKSFALCVHLR
jgi:hypothetical protein